MCTIYIASSCSNSVTGQCFLLPEMLAWMIRTHSSVSAAKRAAWRTTVLLTEPMLAPFQPIVV